MAIQTHDPDDERPRKTIAVDIDFDLYQTIKAEAGNLGIPVSAAARMRLKTGRVATLDAASPSI
jgi:hypothetical protein